MATRRRWFRWLRRVSYLLSAALLLSTIIASAEPAKVYIDQNHGFFSMDRNACQSGATTTLSGDDNIAQIYNYLVGKGLKDYQAAGIMGNIHSESGYQEERLQGTPSGTKTPAESLSGADLSKGWGLVQWTPATKFIDPTKAAGKDPNNLAVQLDFLWAQLTGTGPSSEKAAGDAVMASLDVADATVQFETKYERHAGPPQPDRIVEAERILDLVRNGNLQSGSPTGSAGQATIVLDPGHSGTENKITDPATGLIDYDYPNDAEMPDVFNVAQQVKTKLESDGYKVIMTKNNVNDTVSLRQRADIANQANAALAVSIHDQPDKPFGTFEQIYTQNVGDYRATPDGTKVTFTNTDIAAKSNQYGDVFKQQRSQVESASVDITHTTFDNRAGFSPGNIPMVQLFATVPWVYNEAGGGIQNPDGSRTGLSDTEKATYANALIASIENAVPVSGAAASGGGNGCSNSANVTGLSNAVLAYAWPDYHPAPYTQKTPAYDDAIKKAQAAGQYVGGLSLPGIDCGGFVTRLMIDSGFEPGYNYGGQLSVGAGPVANQRAWLDANWQVIGQVSSSAQLQPGDVAIYKDNSHTYVYVGNIPGFNSTTASSSLGDGNGSGRAPMAGRDDVTASNIIWYRKK